MILKLPYAPFAEHTKVLSWLLEPAIVALALPLYQQFIHVKKDGQDNPAGGAERRSHGDGRDDDYVGCYDDAPFVSQGRSVNVSPVGSDSSCGTRQRSA